MSGPPKAEADAVKITYRVGDLLVDTGRQRVMRGDQAIAVAGLSYDLLLVLIRESPNLVPNDELMDKVWPKSVVSPETLSQRVKLLRDSLGQFVPIALLFLTKQLNAGIPGCVGTF